MRESSATKSALWAPYKPTDAAPWNARRVVHLHRRAGFAATWPQIERDLQDGPEAAVDRLLEGSATAVDAADFEPIARVIGDAAMASGSSGRLQAWWLYRMLFSHDPLGERLALMWHNHFATSNRKVQDLVRMREQNELFRRYAKAPFKELLHAVVKHPAMLAWLDADTNRQGHPNENLARELMELFTLGAGHYSEEDVKQSARALTGWSITDGKFRFRDAWHDKGEKDVLGTRGAGDGDALLNLLVEQPATSRRIAWRLCNTFMGENTVGEEALTELADGLMANDLDIGWGVETILRSQRFFAEENLQARVTSPVEFMIGALRALELGDPPPSTLLLAEWSARMGQDLFYPPNVGGWTEGRAWVGSRAVIARANFAITLAAGELWRPATKPNLEQLMTKHKGNVNFEEGAHWLATLLWGHAPPGVMEQVLVQAKKPSTIEPMHAVLIELLCRPEHYLG